MPAQSTITPEEKIKIKSAIPPSSNKIFGAALARIYYAYPDPRRWSYAGLQGAIVFSKDNTENLVNLKLVDIDGTRGVIWEHELYNGFEFFQDRAFFHSFPGDECMIGIVYADEQEAKAFFKKVNSKKELAAVKKSSSRSKSKKLSVGKKSKIDKAMISGPQSGSFIHIAHMGYDADTGFSTKGIDPSWLALLENLEGKGVSREVIAKEMDFIKTYVQKSQDEPKKKTKPPPPPAPNRRSHVPNGSLQKPPSPPPAPVRVSQPPPAPQRQSQPPPAPQRTQPALPPAPQRTQPVPPPTPHRTQPPPPPPPPPAPQRTQPPPPPAAPESPVKPPGPPAPPRRPFSRTEHLHHLQGLQNCYTPSSSGTSAPAASWGCCPTPSTASSPSSSSRWSSTTASSRSSYTGWCTVSTRATPQPGRNDLLASIRSSGGINALRKTENNSPPPRGSSSLATGAAVAGGAAAGAGVAEAASSGGGGDLTSALAAALLERNKRLGDSDSDEDDGEDDWD
ncbi:hypothetical protein D9756_007233 [Leucocoprinus leucothites]|uniref:WH1-domain-containing protein n=1 Tax=Leucocoprinus leucothites TaxID=201217 RepID=A0A8H5D7N2_9AGAR|nr:hypothetical protein D9756_007233 [Leucoagaricus leucothites]